MVATGTGYRLEVELPLAELGLAAGYGQLFGLDVQANDDDESGPRDSKTAWWAQDETSSANPSVFGAGQLQGPEKTGLTLSNEGAAVRLKWTHYAWRDDAYEVHKSGAPYFAPDERHASRSLPRPRRANTSTRRRERGVLHSAGEAGRPGSGRQSHGEVRV